jgi:hypothetical protein
VAAIATSYKVLINLLSIGNSSATCLKPVSCLYSFVVLFVMFVRR